jgi:hypothetical protein
MEDGDLTDEEVLRENYFALTPGQKLRLRQLLNAEIRPTRAERRLTTEEQAFLLERVSKGSPEVKNSIRSSQAAWIEDGNSFKRYLRFCSAIDLLDEVFEGLGYSPTEYRLADARFYLLVRIYSELSNEGFNMSDPARAPVYRVEPRAGRNLEFTYKGADQRLASPNDAIYVQFRSYLPERNCWVLHHHEKKIGFLAQREKVLVGQTDFSVTNTILLIGESIGGQGSDHIARYKFSDDDELEESVGLMLSAMSAYDGVNDRPQDGAVTVCLAPQAKRQIQFGRLLKR